MIEETKQKLQNVLGGAKIYLETIKKVTPENLGAMSNVEIMSLRGMCKVLLRAYVMITDTLQQLPSLRTNEINDFMHEFKNINMRVEEAFHERINDIDSPDLDEIIETYKKDVKFLENWLNNVYQPTVDLFTSMNPNEIQAFTFEITFKQISQHWHHKDMLLGLCDDLGIYKNRLHEVSRKLDFLYNTVNAAKQNRV